MRELPPETEILIRSDLEFFQKHFKTDRLEPNLTEAEIAALTELTDNDQIVIKPADKGSAIVILDKQQYLWECHRQLSDENYYLKLPKPIYPDTVPIVAKILNQLHKNKIISAKQKAYLLGPSEPRPRLFYILPKIHKDPIKWSLPYKIPPGRPIVSDCSSETYGTAEFIDFYLNPLSKLHQSYVKDAYHFIDIIKNIQIPIHSMLFTIDVDSLYTNIVTEEGINAVLNVFQKNPDGGRPDKEIIQLLEINLLRNDFQFNGEWFLQVKGTAMGKRFAPAYADIFMAEWETSALGTCDKKPLHYHRYLDDIWGVWTYSEEEFNHFLHTLNNHNASIKLKSSTSLTAVDFLDTTTFKGPDFNNTGKLDIKVYFKPTDTHALLFKSSFHPKHTFAGLVKSQLIRFHRICTQKTDFYEAVRVLFSALSKRGYQRSFLRRCLRSFSESRRPEDTMTLPFISTYSPANVNLAQGLRKNLLEFQSISGRLTDRVMPAFRRNGNLKDHLVHAKLKSQIEPSTIEQGQCFRHQKWLLNHCTHKVYLVPPGGGPQTQNCVYLIRCRVCRTRFVGHTANTMLARLVLHEQDVSKKKVKKPHVLLTTHFIKHGWSAARIMVLEHDPNWTMGRRTKRALIWVARLSTRSPLGLNEQ